LRLRLTVRAEENRPTTAVDPGDLTAVSRRTNA
jgi:hypothetical protein